LGVALVAALDFADGEGRGVASRLLGRRIQVGEEPVGHSVGIESKTIRVIRGEALQEGLGGQRATPRSACFDAGRFVDLVSKRNNVYGGPEDGSCGGI